MDLFQYCKQRDWLPEPKGLLLLAILLRAMDCEVTEATTGDKKRGSYEKYSLEEKCQMGHYTCNNFHRSGPKCAGKT